MNLSRWEPFKDADDFFRQLAPEIFRGARLPVMLNARDLQWSPVADISETEKEYVVKAELPGVKREDVKVTVEDGILTITGERKLEKEDKTERAHRVERFHGSFARSFSLPENADVANVRADSRDGVLNVHIPKVATSKTPRTVQVQVQ